MADDPVNIAFERALEGILARVFSCASGAPPVLGVAYSGGMDSSVLLHLAKAFSVQRGHDLHAFHVHHGLSVHADDWAHHCESECARLGIDCEVVRVSVRAGGAGVEQSQSAVVIVGHRLHARRHRLVTNAAP